MKVPSLALILILGSLQLVISHRMTAQAMKDEKYKPLEADYFPVISRLSVLSIHVRDSVMVDSIFHFLTDKLGLPVEYRPLKWMDRKYAGVYAGDMFLEPCGPFANFLYASNNFKAIFFGMNCESDRSLSSLAEDFTARGIDIEQSSTIQVIDTAIIKQNIYFSVASRQLQNSVNEDSLRVVMTDNNRNRLGIERIKEVRVGYTDNVALTEWKKMILPSVLSGEGVWNVNGNQSVRFEKSGVREVASIVFRVKSLEQAKKWLSENKMLGKSFDGEISLDSSKTFGLMILLSEKDD